MTIETSTTSHSQEQGVRIQSEKITESRAIAGLFGFLSRCLEQEMDAATIEMIRTDLREPLVNAGLEFDDDFYSTDIDTLVESLAEEYTGLFVAPGCISPYASVFETGCMFKEPADRALKAYREAGLDYQNRMSGEFPDHIGTMLGFYGQLAETEAEFMATGEIAEADAARCGRESFMSEQLAEWGPAWCNLASRAAVHSFYRVILKVAEQVLLSELTQLVDRRRLRELAELNRREPKKLEYDADFRKASGL